MSDVRIDFREVVRRSAATVADLSPKLENMNDLLLASLTSAGAFVSGYVMCRFVDRASSAVRFARQATDVLRNVSDRISRDVARHSLGVQETESRLRNRAASLEELSRCAAEILEANAELRNRLSEAQDQLSIQTKLLCQHVHAARQDALTGLHNRLALDEYLEERMTVSRRGEATALLTIDVDHFKRVNDEYGHLAGDAALKSVASAISAAAPKNAFVARYGGEEIFVCMPGDEDEELLSIAERVRAAVAEPLVHYRDVRFRVSASGGLARSTDFATVTEWIEAADRGLYLAKESGRDRGMALTRGVYRPFLAPPDRTKSSAIETDASTGLPTRKAFARAVSERIRGDGESSCDGCLMSIRLDALDDVIKNFGYRTADAALQAVAKSVAECLRPEDLATKWDLKTFAIYLADADETAAESVAVRIERRLAQTIAERIDRKVELRPIRGYVRLAKEATLDEAIAESQRAGIGCSLTA